MQDFRGMIVSATSCRVKHVYVTLCGLSAWSENSAMTMQTRQTRVTESGTFDTRRADLGGADGLGVRGVASSAITLVLPFMIASENIIDDETCALFWER